MRERLEAAYQKALAALLAERHPDGYWVGELSTSALSTATAAQWSPFAVGLQSDLVVGNIVQHVTYVASAGASADTPVRLLVTASDTIRPWRLPQFGLDLSGIPGRIEEATIKLPPGEVGDRDASPGADEKPVAVRVLAPEAYADWEGQTLPPSCFVSG